MSNFSCENRRSNFRLARIYIANCDSGFAFLNRYVEFETEIYCWFHITLSLRKPENGGNILLSIVYGPVSTSARQSVNPVSRSEIIRCH